MKKTIFTILISIGILSLNAQMIFTRTDFTKIPATYNYHVDDSFVLSNVSTTGGGLMWDFTTVNDGKEFASKFLVASTTPDYKDFPNTDIAFQKDAKSKIMYYMKDGNDSIVVVGSNDPTLSNVHFRPMIFPLKLNTAWNDKGSQMIKAKGSDFGITQADSVKATVVYSFKNIAESEGKLKLPSGEVDVIKVRTINKVTITAQAKISNFWLPLPGLIPDVNDTTYAFYAKESGYSVVTMESNNNGSFNVKYQELKKNTSSINQINISQNNLTVYPNPATNLITISFNKGNRFEITDMIGRNIIIGNIENNTIDISTLSQGNYIIRVFMNNEITGVQKFLKQ